MNGKRASDPFGMGEFSSETSKVADFSHAKEGFGRVPLLEPQKISDFSLESLDPLRN
jgi:hypothetical protein